MKIKLITAVLAIAGVFLVTSVAVPKAVETKKEKVILLKDSNTLVLNGEVDGESVSQVMLKARELADNDSIFGIKKDKGPIYLFLYTPGGSVQKGLELMEALKGIGRPVHTITLFAASMGFQLAQNLDKRYILSKGTLMSHHATGGIEGEIGGQSPSQTTSRLRNIENQLEEMDKQTVSRTNGKQTLESYQKAYENELWTTGKEAAEQGYADEVVTIKCDKSLAGVATKEIMFMGLIPIQYDIDNCPINTTPMNIRIKIDTTEGKMDSDSFLKLGGSFGTSCLQSSGVGTKLCALDSTLTLEKIGQYKLDFLDRFVNIQNHIIKMKL